MRAVGSANNGGCGVRKEQMCGGGSAPEMQALKPVGRLAEHGCRRLHQASPKPGAPSPEQVQALRRVVPGSHRPPPPAPRPRARLRG
jgi:hypothetical protein